MNRRYFIKTSSIGVMSLSIFGAATMNGCTVFDHILTWIPVGLTAIQGIVTVLGILIPGPAAQILLIVKAAFADLSATVSEYNNDTNPTDKATLLAKIRTILTDIVSNFQSFLLALNIGNNPIGAIVLSLANVIISALEGFMSQIPSGSSTLTLSLQVGNKSVPVTPKLYKSVKAFKNDYNVIALANKHPEIVIN